MGKKSNEITNVSSNDSFRAIRISRFRNIGVFGHSPATLTINRSLEKKDLGNLILLIGPNNSGKSNVLDAIKAFARGETEEDDVTDFIYDERSAPKIELIIRDVEKFHIKQLGDSHEEHLENKGGVFDSNYSLIDAILTNGFIKESDIDLKEYREAMSLETKLSKQRTMEHYAFRFVEVTDKLKTNHKEINKINTSFFNQPIGAAFKNLFNGLDPAKYSDKVFILSIKELKKLLENSDKDNTDYDLGLLMLTRTAIDYCKEEKLSSLKKFNAINDLVFLSDFIDKTLESNYPDFNSNYYLLNYSDLLFISDYALHNDKWDLNPIDIITSLSKNFNHTEEIKEEPKKNAKSEQKNTWEKEFQEKFGYNAVPRIISYDQKHVKQSDLKCGYILLNDFIRSVLSYINVDEDEIIKRYGEAKKKKLSSILSRKQDEMNRKVAEMINTRFNDLYFCDSEMYDFKFKLNDESINFELYRGDTIMDLDNQSTGFRWFFDFFFNFICGGNLESGDIILMDEPATNLHVSGQYELRRFMKEFSKEFGVTFIVSTHSPFLIDIDYLDEVRMMSLGYDGNVSINDKFTVIPDEELDTMDQVLRGLTVSRHIIIDPHCRTIFVEGITDYNYLTAFKELLGVKGVCFLPINGLKRKDLVERLLLLDKEPALLVDSDGIGMDLKKSSEHNALTVTNLNEIDKNFKFIEDLFSKEDRELFKTSDKSFDKSSVFKNRILTEQDEISDETKKNFERVLDYLVNI